MGVEGLEHLQPDDYIVPGAIDDAVRRVESKELPLTLEDGTRIGTAKIHEVDDGVEIEASIDEEYKNVVNLEGTALSLSSTEARVVTEQQILEQEEAELSKLFTVYSALKANRIQKVKEKTQRRAKNKRARKSRKGSR